MKIGGRQTPSPGSMPRLGHDLIARPQLASNTREKTPEVKRSDSRRRRIMLTVLCFAAAFSIVTGRLMTLGLFAGGDVRHVAAAEVREPVQRRDIVDRNGEVMATDIITASLYADARKVLDPRETARQIFSVLPDLELTMLEERLASGRAFVWLKRDVTPREQQAVHNLGQPGLGFRREQKRVYPNGNTASHVLGSVDVDNRGTAGMEYYIDNSDDLADGALELSIDLRVQHAVRTELAAAMEEFSAKAAIGVVMDVTTGEVVASVSLPDFDPNDPMGSPTRSRFNAATLGVYEMGSTFKAFSVAAALDSGRINLSTSYDAREPIRVSRFTISDYHAQKRYLSVPELFMHSSNIGTAKMVLDLGREEHRGFLGRLGLLTRAEIELPEAGRPLLPDRWTDVSAMTISYGHGLSVSPLNVVAANATLVNGGLSVRPTFLRRRGLREDAAGERVMSQTTSDAMRALLRLVVEQGTGRNADVMGYPVMGKTGTAEKAVNGGYAKRALLTSFLSAFPANDPRYSMLVVFDEPQATPETYGYATAGWNAAPVTSRVVRRIAPILGLRPVDAWDAPIQAASLLVSE
ncbi:MAG: penicillin-binding protein 2 [Parvibaculaceae bacterium]|nr:penicillin-binding protein 2 [Parvibaculaceae bacterium]